MRLLIFLFLNPTVIPIQQSIALLIILRSRIHMRSAIRFYSCNRVPHFHLCYLSQLQSGDFRSHSGFMFTTVSSMWYHRKIYGQGFWRIVEKGDVINLKNVSGNSDF